MAVDIMYRFFGGCILSAVIEFLRFEQNAWSGDDELFVRGLRLVLPLREVSAGDKGGSKLFVGGTYKTARRFLASSFFSLVVTSRELKDGGANCGS